MAEATPVLEADQRVVVKVKSFWAAKTNWLALFPVIIGLVDWISGTPYVTAWLTEHPGFLSFYGALLMALRTYFTSTPTTKPFGIGDSGPPPNSSG